MRIIKESEIRFLEKLFKKYGFSENAISLIFGSGIKHISNTVYVLTGKNLKNLLNPKIKGKK